MEYYEERNKLCFVCKYQPLWSHEYFNDDMKEEFCIGHCRLDSTNNIKFYDNNFHMNEHNTFEGCYNFELNNLNISKLEVKQIDIDYFQIKMYDRKIKICGGDLESLFSSLFGIEEIE